MQLTVPTVIVFLLKTLKLTADTIMKQLQLQWIFLGAAALYAVKGELLEALYSNNNNYSLCSECCSIFM